MISSLSFSGKLYLFIPYIIDPLQARHMYWYDLFIIFADRNYFT